MDIIKASEEKRRHSSMLVPYSYYRNVIPDYYSSAAPHWHNEFEICSILSGSCLFTRKGKSFTAQKGDIVIVQPNIVHSVSVPENGQMVHDVLVFHPRILTNGCEDRLYNEIIQPIISGESVVRAPVNSGNPYYDEIKISMDNVFSCAGENTSNRDLLLKSELMRMFWLLIESGDICCAEKKDIKLSESIHPAIAYIDKHYAENITVDMLAESVHLSKSYFMCRFKSAVGMSPIDYVNQVRIKAVCSLLVSAPDKITDIAFACGFRNISNFNRQFEKIAGCKPIEYRTSRRLFSHAYAPH